MDTYRSSKILYLNNSKKKEKEKYLQERNERNGGEEINEVCNPYHLVLYADPRNR